MALPSGSTAPATTRRGTIVPPQSATRYIEKRKEVEAILALERATAEVASRFDALSHDLDVVAEAAKVHGSVLAHWPHMFELVALFLNRSTSNNPNLQSKMDEAQESASPEGERLVRIPTAALQSPGNS